MLRVFQWQSNGQNGDLKGRKEVETVNKDVLPSLKGRNGWFKKDPLYKMERLRDAY